MPGTEIMKEEEMDWSLGLATAEPVIFRTPIPTPRKYAHIQKRFTTITGEKMCGSSHVGPITWTGVLGSCATCCGTVAR